MLSRHPLKIALLLWLLGSLTLFGGCSSSESSLLSRRTGGTASEVAGTAPMDESGGTRPSAGSAGRPSNDTGFNTDCTAYGAGYVCDRSTSFADPRVCTCTDDGTGALNWVCVHQNAAAGN
jgi:hypothetical protein